MLQEGGQSPVGLDEIDAPDDSVLIELGGILRGEVERDERGIRPVEEAGGKSAMLPDCEPVPDRIGGVRLAVPVLAEVPQQRDLEPADICFGLGEPQQRTGKRVRFAIESAKRER